MAMPTVAEAEEFDADDAEEVEEAIPLGEEEVLAGGSGFGASAAQAAPSSNADIYLSLLIVSAAAYLTATIIVIHWLRDYVNPERWWFW